MKHIWIKLWEQKKYYNEMHTQTDAVFNMMSVREGEILIFFEHFFVKLMNVLEKLTK
jgi:hypothetical protein